MIISFPPTLPRLSLYPCKALCSCVCGDDTRAWVTGANGKLWLGPSLPDAIILSWFDCSRERSPHKDPSKVLSCVIMQSITQNAAGDPKAWLRRHSQSPLCVMPPHRCPQRVALAIVAYIKQSCPRKTPTLHTDDVFQMCLWASSYCKAGLLSHWNMKM